MAVWPHRVPPLVPLVVIVVRIDLDNYQYTIAKWPQVFWHLNSFAMGSMILIL